MRVASTCAGAVGTAGGALVRDTGSFAATVTGYVAETYTLVHL